MSPTLTLAMINQIVKIEWDMFSTVNNTEGLAKCQENPELFCVMRIAQAMIWQPETLTSYLQDLQTAQSKDINLMTEKYIRMMEVTHPAEYNRIRALLPPFNRKAVFLTEQIMAFFNEWENEINQRYPKLRRLGRLQQDTFYNTSTLNYLRSELLTFSIMTLNLCLRDVRAAYKQRHNLAEDILKNTARYYAYDSLESLENSVS